MKMKTRKIIKPHGGKRAGSGNKPKYLEPTKTIAFRVPESKIPELRALITNYLLSSIWVNAPKDLSLDEIKLIAERNPLLYEAFFKLYKSEE